MKISIIIPVYQGGRYIRRCVESIIKQGLKDIEIIIIDDGSTDQTRYILQELQEIYMGIRILHQQNQGPMMARIIGATLAIGEYLWFIDADDYLPKNALQILYDESLTSKADIVLFHAYTVNEIKVEPLKMYYESVNIIKQDPIKSFLDGNIYGALWGKLIRKSFWDQCQMNFPQKSYFGEDGAMTFALLVNKPNIHCLNSTLYCYFNNPEGITNGTKVLDIIKTLVCYENTLKSAQLFSEYKESLIKFSKIQLQYVSGLLKYNQDLLNQLNEEYEKWLLRIESNLEKSNRQCSIHQHNGEIQKDTYQEVPKNPLVFNQFSQAVFKDISSIDLINNNFNIDDFYKAELMYFKNNNSLLDFILKLISDDVDQYSIQDEYSPYILGMICFHSRQFDEGYKYFLKLKSDYISPLVLRNSAYYFYVKGDFKTANMLLSQAISLKNKYFPSKIAPNVSIVIPVYNTEKYLKCCLDSVINQKLENIEIIIVNDGSTDNSAEIIKVFASCDKRIRVINQENHGLSHARNQGLKLAAGEYVYFLDSDDYIGENTLIECFNFAHQNQLDILTFDATVFADQGYDGDLLHEEYNRKEIKCAIYRGEDFFAYSKSINKYYSSVCLNLYNRSFLLKNHLLFYEGILHEDELHTFKSFLRAERIAYYPKSFFYRRIRDNSIMTKKKTEINARSLFEVAKEAEFFLKQAELKSQTNVFAKSHVNSLYMSCIRDCDIVGLDSLRQQVAVYIKNREDQYLPLLFQLDYPELYYDNLKKTLES